MCQKANVLFLDPTLHSGQIWNDASVELWYFLLSVIVKTKSSNFIEDNILWIEMWS